jgi:hypothetical protein
MRVPEPSTEASEESNERRFGSPLPSRVVSRPAAYGVPGPSEWSWGRRRPEVPERRGRNRGRKEREGREKGLCDVRTLGYTT